MLSGLVAESESRFDSKLSALSGEKDTESTSSLVQLGKMGTKSDGFGTQYFEANRVEAFILFMGSVSCAAI